MTREDDLHELPGRALPCDGSQASADVAHVAAVTDAAVDVADDSAREREVQEDRPVVRGDGGGQRQVDAEAARDDVHRHAQQIVVTTPMAAAAARAPPSTARTPSRNGPAPRRQTTMASVAAAPTARAHAHIAGVIRSSRQHQQVGVADGDGEPAGSRLGQPAAST